MNKLKTVLLASTFVGLFACTPTQPTKVTPKGYLKDNISQAELANPTNFKRYYYDCQNLETGTNSVLSNYFPLWRESRMTENFGFYFQLDGAKAEPFDHLENKNLNSRGTRFEVTYRSYYPIQGSYVSLSAYENRSIYYKNYQGFQKPWLKCREV